MDLFLLFTTKTALFFIISNQSYKYRQQINEAEKGGGNVKTETKSFMLKLPEDIKQEIKLKSAQLGITMQNFIKCSIEKQLKQHNSRMET